MSTLSLRKIKHDSSSVDNITLDSSGNVGINKTTPRATGGFNSLSLNGTDGSEIWFDAGNTAATRLSGTASETRITAQASGSVITMFTGATERLRVDNSGRITMPYQPFAHATLSSTQTVTGSGTIIQFNSVIQNVGGHFNTSNYRFTAPITGDYLVMVGLRRNSASTSGYTRATVRKNGIGGAVNLGIVDPIWNLPNGGYNTTTQDCVLRLAANDYLDVIDYSQYFNTVYADNECHFIVRLLG